VKPYYEDGSVTIYHGDARAWLPPADVIVTDPPYGMKYKSGWSGADVAGDLTSEVRDEVLAAWDGPALVFGRWSIPRPRHVRHLLIWDKGDWPGMGDLALPWGPSTEEIYVIGRGFCGPRKGSVIRDPHRPTGENALHPTQKPVAVMSRLIEACPPPWTILDPFMGSGSTLLAAKNLGRRAIGIEIEERYCEIAARRCSQEVLGLDAA
jgi:DNA modification methylase